MAINIKDPETDRLAREVAAATGETITEAIQVSLRERFEKLKATQRPDDVVAQIDAISRRVAALPVLDDRSADEIIGYDEHGIPT